MRYLPLINMKCLVFFLAETDVYWKYDVKLLTMDARVAWAAVSRSVSLILVKENAKVTCVIHLYQPFDIVSFYMCVKYLYLCQKKIDKL